MERSSYVNDGFLKGKHRKSNNLSFGEEFYSREVSCPPTARNYSCSFCKRQFMSAQALGGHMNVHRRDRARLRSLFPSASWVSDDQFPKPNPNPNLSPNAFHLPSPSAAAASSSSLSLAHEFLPHQNSVIYPPFASNSVSYPISMASNSKEKKPAASSSSFSHQHHPLLGPQSKDITFKKNLMKSSPLAIGVRDLMGCAQLEDKYHSKSDLKTNENNIISLDLEMGLFKHPKEDVDLELRLGHI